MFKHLMYAEKDSNHAILHRMRGGCWIVSLCEDDFGFSPLTQRKAFADEAQAREFYHQLPHPSTYFSHSRFPDPTVKIYGITISQFALVGQTLYHKAHQASAPSESIDDIAAFTAYTALVTNLLGSN